LSFILFFFSRSFFPFLSLYTQPVHTKCSLG
jgi:hypothetical protein